MAWELPAAALDLALIWKLCGLVADLARRSQHPDVERSALSRRGVYIAFKVIGVAGVAVALARPELILPVAVVLGAGAFLGFFFSLLRV